MKRKFVSLLLLSSALLVTTSCGEDTPTTSSDTSATDDAMAVEQYSGHKVKLIMGSYDNIKVTTPEDVRISRAFFRTRKVFKVLHDLHDRIIWFQMKLYLLNKKKHAEHTDQS